MSYVKKKPSAKEIICVLHDICEGLANLHKKGIIHRDIKPGNLFTLNGRGVVGDLGMAIQKNDFTAEYIKLGGYLGGDMQFHSPTLLLKSEQVRRLLRKTKTFKEGVEKAKKELIGTHVDIYAMGTTFL